MEYYDWDSILQFGEAEYPVTKYDHLLTPPVSPRE
jgi:hypothetical protein